MSPWNNATNVWLNQPYSIFRLKQGLTVDPISGGAARTCCAPPPPPGSATVVDKKLVEWWRCGISLKREVHIPLLVSLHHLILPRYLIHLPLDKTCNQTKIKTEPQTSMYIYRQGCHWDNNNTTCGISLKREVHIPLLVSLHHLILPGYLIHLPQDKTCNQTRPTTEPETSHTDKAVSRTKTIPQSVIILQNFLCLRAET